MSLSEKLILYIDAGFPILFIHSYEENKIDKIIRDSSAGREIFEWNGVSGFSDFETKKSFNLMDVTLQGSLKHLINSDELDGKIIVLKDVHSLLDDPEVIAILKSIALKISICDIETTIIIESSRKYIPKELEPYTSIFEMDYLNTEDIKKIIQNVIDENELNQIRNDLLEEIAISFKGLSQFEIENILALAVNEDNGDLTKGSLSFIFEQKRQMIMKSGILDMIPRKETINDIGGLDNLKEWLTKKSKIFKNIDKAKEFGVDIPKGVLIAGVPGCGKSLNAKAAAELFEVPLLRLDMGRIMGKYVGESEANMRKAISLAEAISPCVVWIDELEKGLAGIGGDSGGSDVTTRLFGSLLTWMQEKESAAFVVATANDITKLPPELLRKGRFDEIFYVGLPNDSERKKIFEIHIAKRRKNDDELKNIDFDKLISRTRGYSGADIEGVIKESIENVYVAEKDKLTTEDILDVIKNTHSLSEIMKEPLKKMSEEYENRKFKNASIEG